MNELSEAQHAVLRAHYAVEVPPGLVDRIMARVAAAPVKRSFFAVFGRMSWPVAATAVAAAILLMVLSGTVPTQSQHGSTVDTMLGEQVDRVLFSGFGGKQ